MLEIFNNLKPFFEDVFREISVREYARILKISPPTASTVLNNLAKEEILIKTKDRIYLNFRANRENSLFADLARIFWKQILSSELVKIHNLFLYKEIILFGSISKCENNLDSDVDIFIDIPPKNIDINLIEKRLKRKIQIHFSDSKKNVLLYENIKKGVKIL